MKLWDLHGAILYLTHIFQGPLTPSGVEVVMWAAASSPSRYRPNSCWFYKHSPVQSSNRSPAVRPRSDGTVPSPVGSAAAKTQRVQHEQSVQVPRLPSHSLRRPIGSVLLPEVDVSGPFDHRLWRPIEEDQLGVELLLQLQLSCFPNLHTQKAVIWTATNHRINPSCLALWSEVWSIIVAAIKRFCKWKYEKNLETKLYFQI